MIEEAHNDYDDRFKALQDQALLASPIFGNLDVSRLTMERATGTMKNLDHLEESKFGGRISEGLKGEILKTGVAAVSQANQEKRDTLKNN